MNIKKLNPSDALAAMVDWSGQTLTLVLPFGIPGDTEDATRIERKNALKAAGQRLEKLDNKHFSKHLKNIEKDHEDASKHFAQTELPATVLYFINEDGTSLSTEVGSALRSYFYLGDVPELEPLVYTNWSSDSFHCIKLDLEDPQIMIESAGKLVTLPPKVNNRLSAAYGTSWKDFKFSNVIEIADKNNEAGTHLDKGHPNNTYGYSSRQKSHRDKNIEFWLRMINEIVVDTLSTKVENPYIYATDSIASQFLEINQSLKNTNISQVKAVAELQDLSSELKAILSELTANKKSATLSTLQGNQQPEQRVAELNHLLETGQARQLIVKEQDWFNARAKGRTDYEIANSRSPILLKAIRKRVPIAFTDSSFENDEGIAAFGYGT